MWASGMGDFRSRNVWNLCLEMHRKQKKKGYSIQDFCVVLGGNIVSVAKAHPCLPKIEHSAYYPIPAKNSAGDIPGTNTAHIRPDVFLGHRSEIIKRVVENLSFLFLLFPLLSSFLSPLLISLARLFVHLHSTSFYLFLYIPSFLSPISLSPLIDSICLIP